jgi:hypothetical protein
MSHYITDHSVASVIHCVKMAHEGCTLKKVFMYNIHMKK